MLKTDLLYSCSVLGRLWLNLRNPTSERVYALAFALEVITLAGAPAWLCFLLPSNLRFNRFIVDYSSSRLGRLTQKLLFSIDALNIQGYG